jgi:hypothetical protein
MLFPIIPSHVSTKLLIKHNSSDQIEKNEMGGGGGGHVLRRDNRRGYTGFWRGILREKDNLEGVGVDTGIMLQEICKKEVGCGHRQGRAGSGKGQVASSCECGNDPSGSKNSENFLTYSGSLSRTPFGN